MKIPWIRCRMRELIRHTSYVADELGNRPTKRPIVEVHAQTAQ